MSKNKKTTTATTEKIEKATAKAEQTADKLTFLAEQILANTLTTKSYIQKSVCPQWYNLSANIHKTTTAYYVAMEKQADNLTECEKACYGAFKELFQAIGKINGFNLTFTDFSSGKSTLMSDTFAIIRKYKPIDITAKMAKARNEYTTAKKAYNKAVADNKPNNEIADLKTAMDSKKEVFDKAVVKSGNTKYVKTTTAFNSFVKPFEVVIRLLVNNQYTMSTEELKTARATYNKQRKSNRKAKAKT